MIEEQAEIACRVETRFVFTDRLTHALLDHLHVQTRHKQEFAAPKRGRQTARKASA